MPRIVPSQVIAFIEKKFREVVLDGADRMARPYGAVSGLLDLRERIPDELLPADPQDFADLISSVAILQFDQTGGELTVEETRAIRSIHRVLAACPDDAPPPGTTDDLTFIDDDSLRADLGRDLGEVNRALQDHEWKAATVLAGSVVETLLLWTLQTHKPTEVAAAEAERGKTIEWWGLGALIDLAHATGLITDNTQTAVNLGKDFRNLIHPGRAARLAQKCDRSTALLGAGAVAAVIADLS